LSTVPRTVLVLAPTTERQALPAVFATGATWLPARCAAAAGRDRLFRTDGERAFDPLEALARCILAADDYPATCASSLTCSKRPHRRDGDHRRRRGAAVQARTTTSC
jgi:hypothetical protein